MICISFATETILEVFWGLFKCLVFKFSRIPGLNAPGQVYTPKSSQIAEFKTVNVSLMNKAWVEIHPTGFHHKRRHERGPQNKKWQRSLFNVYEVSSLALFVVQSPERSVFL